jgi:hypothetical protein
MNKFQLSLVVVLVALVLGIEVVPRIATAALPTSGPQYFSAHMSCTGNGNCSVPGDQEIPVPAGKRFLIQYVSATASVDGLAPQQAMIRMTVPYYEGSSTCSSYEYGLPATWEGVIGGKSQFSSAQQMNVTATPPQQTCSYGKGIGAYLNSTSASQPVSLQIHVSGYLQ